MARVYTTGSLNATDGPDILNVVRDNAATLGWTVHDDYITGGNQIVLSSEGGSYNNGRLPCYLCFAYTGVTNLRITLYLYWDSSTHVGYNRIDYTFSDDYPYNTGVHCDISTSNTVTLTGNKDFMWVDLVKSSDSSLDTLLILRIDALAQTHIGEWQTTTFAGTNVTVQLKENQAATFKLGSEYRVVSTEGHVDKVFVTSIDTVTDQIVLDNMYYTVSSGSKLGAIPFPWVINGNANQSNSLNVKGLTGDTDYLYSTTTTLSTVDNLEADRDTTSSTYSNEWINHGEITLRPWTFYEVAYGTWGASSYLHYCNYGNEGDIIGINQLDIGTTISGTLSTVSDISKDWADDVFQGNALLMLTGTQQDTIRYVTSNTFNTLTVEPNFSAIISDDDSFVLCEAFYIRKKLFDIGELALRAVY